MRNLTSCVLFVLRLPGRISWLCPCVQVGTCEPLNSQKYDIKEHIFYLLFLHSICIHETNDIIVTVSCSIPYMYNLLAYVIDDFTEANMCLWLVCLVKPVTCWLTSCTLSHAKKTPVAIHLKFSWHIQTARDRSCFESRTCLKRSRMLYKAMLYYWEFCEMFVLWWLVTVNHERRKHKLLLLIIVLLYKAWLNVWNFAISGWKWWGKSGDLQNLAVCPRIAIFPSFVKPWCESEPCYNHTSIVWLILDCCCSWMTFLCNWQWRGPDS